MKGTETQSENQKIKFPLTSILSPVGRGRKREGYFLLPWRRKLARRATGEGGNEGKLFSLLYT
ncbi:MAG TPA: hypothetical protein P5150_03170 [Candidatus Ratteibacteria bacterium]|nr:hypothetical protein [bacterium]HRR95717.1 hypothetical protein [Candidatus Ratteibacteria bacterium]